MDRAQSEDSLILADSSWPEDRELTRQPSSSAAASASQFFQPPPPRRGVSPSKRDTSPLKGRKERDQFVNNNDKSSAGKHNNNNNNNAVDNPRDRFRGAKNLFLSLERKKDNNKQRSSPIRKKSPLNKKETVGGGLRKGRDVSQKRSTANLEVKQLEGQARWSRYEQEAGGGNKPADSRWPKSDRDTGYASRFSREKSRSRDFDDSPTPPSTTAAVTPTGGGGGKANMFTKSGKKSSHETKDKYSNHHRRMSRFLSRETLESDGYDKIDEFDEPEPLRNKVKRNHSRTSLKLDMRKEELGGPELPPGGPRRGMLRREVTELDLKGYRHHHHASAGAPPGGHHHPAAADPFARKYVPRQGPPAWAKERAMSPVRALSPVRGGIRYLEEGERYHHPATKVIPPEYRRDGGGGGLPHHHHHNHHPHHQDPPHLQHHPHNPQPRYPSLDYRNDKRKTVFESDMRALHQHDSSAGGGGPDYRRRSYHELSDIDKLEASAAARNFQHSGRKMITAGGGDPFGNPGPRGYKPLPDPPTPRAYKPLPDPPRASYKPLPDHPPPPAQQQRYPGLERENSRINLGPLPYKGPGGGFQSRGGPPPLPFDHPASRPAMYRHSYAENTNPSSFARVSPSPLGGRFGLASLKPY